MARVIRDDDEWSIEAFEIFLAQHGHGHEAPDQRLEQASLRNEPRAGMHRRGVAVPARHGLSLTRAAAVDCWLSPHCESSEPPARMCPEPPAGMCPEPCRRGTQRALPESFAEVDGDGVTLVLVEHPA